MHGVVKKLNTFGTCWAVFKLTKHLLCFKDDWQINFYYYHSLSKRLKEKKEHCNIERTIKKFVRRTIGANQFYSMKVKYPWNSKKNIVEASKLNRRNKVLNLIAKGGTKNREIYNHKKTLARKNRKCIEKMIFKFSYGGGLLV